MATNIVPPARLSRVILLKCFRCGALYTPEGKQIIHLVNGISYEKCPICGYEHNSDGQRIPVWKYKFIRYFRDKINGDNQISNEENEE